MKSVNIWRRYVQKFAAYFLATLYIINVQSKASQHRSPVGMDEHCARCRQTMHAVVLATCESLSRIRPHYSYLDGRRRLVALTL